MSTELDWMPFSPRSWCGSETVCLLSPLGELALFRLVCYIWQHGSVPADPAACVKITRADIPVEDMATAVQHLLPHPTLSGRLTPKRTHEERIAQAAKHEKNKQLRSDAGKKSASVRSANPLKSKGKNKIQQPFNSCSTAVQQNPTDKEEDRDKEEEAEASSATPAAGGEKPSANVLSAPPDDAAFIRREVASLPATLRHPSFSALWADWIIHLIEAKGKRPSSATLREHAATCLAAHTEAGPEAATDALRFAISVGRERPIRDTRPAKAVPALPANQAEAAAAATRAADAPYESHMGLMPPPRVARPAPLATA